MIAITFLAGQQPRGGGNLTFLISLGLMVAIFYFLLIRPQQRRSRQQRELVTSLEVGDEVVTIGGLFGTIRALDDETVTLEAGGTQFRYMKQAIARRLVEEPEETEGFEEEADEEQ